MPSSARNTKVARERSALPRMKQRCVVIAGGGTGGHVYPAVAIAQAFVAQGARVEFVGMASGMEATVVSSYEWPFHPIAGAKLKGQGWLSRLRSLGVVTRACWQSWKILRRTRPDCVVGVGGYVSGPLVLTAWLRRIPTVIHEQNSVPGLTNRILGRLVRKVCTTFAESDRYFPKGKVVGTGMPVRHNLVEACSQLTPPPAPPWVILVMGGSQGARRLNELVIDMLPGLAHLGIPCRMIHQIGRWGDQKSVEAAYAKAGIEATVVPFIDEMEKVYPQVHLTISRAGSGSLAELTLANIPAILIPFPHAADNHQEMNARETVAQGGALVLHEKDATADRLLEMCDRLLHNPSRLNAMRDAMQRLARPTAAAQVVAVCNGLMKYV